MHRVHTDVRCRSVGMVLMGQVQMLTIFKLVYLSFVDKL